MPIEQGKFTIQRKTRRNGATKARRKLFLDTLAETANATMAAKAAGFHLRTAYVVKKRDAEFAQLWVEAVEEGVERLREALIAQQLGQLSSGDNPTGERDQPPAIMLDPVKALAALKAFGGFGDGRRRTIKPATQADVDRVLMARLEALALRMGKAEARAARRVIEGGGEQEGGGA